MPNYYDIFLGKMVYDSNDNLDSKQNKWKTGPAKIKYDGPPVDNPSYFFPCTVTKTGGSAGDNVTPCSFVYSVKYPDSTVIASSKAPMCSRARAFNAKVIQATNGIAYVDTTGEVQLWDCDETVDQCAGVCS